MKRRLTPLAILLIAGLVALTVALCMVAGCASPTNEPTPAPTPNALLTVGQTVQDVHDAMMLWKVHTEAHPACQGAETRGCVTAEEAERVAAALRAYSLTRTGPHRADDYSPDTPEAIRASRDLVVAIADAMERTR